MQNGNESSITVTDENVNEMTECIQSNIGTDIDNTAKTQPYRAFV